MPPFGRSGVRETGGFSEDKHFQLIGLVLLFVSRLESGGWQLFLLAHVIQLSWNCYRVSEGLSCGVLSWGTFVVVLCSVYSFSLNIYTWYHPLSKKVKWRPLPYKELA